MAIGNFLTTSEVAGRLGVTAMRVRQFVKDGRLSPQKVGNVLLFDAAQVTEFSKVPRPTGSPPRKKSAR